MSQKISTAPDSFCVAALYRFAAVSNPAELCARIKRVIAELDICGTLIIAAEGINGTVAGSDDAIAELIAFLRTISGCEDMDVKYSRADARPFGRMKVKLKQEIVTLGVPGVDPVDNAGTHVEPLEWNALIANPETIVIDTRNDYEVGIGSFAGAINPQTHSFREFPAWLEKAGKSWKEQGRTAPKIAMFCTGGIRCEKSTALAKSMGYDDVYHLKGGILKYLEEVPVEQSLWHGNCFVFDERISVSHGLAITDDQMCRLCGHPFSTGRNHACKAE